MERNKYIAAIVLGFLAILAIGVISIKLFRAKRSTAPEHDAMVTITPTPSPVAVGAGGEVAYAIPDIASSVRADAASFPASLQALMGEAQASAQLMSVEFKSGQTGLQFTREVPMQYETVTATFKEAILRDRSMLAYRIGAEESTFAFRSTDPRGRVVITAKEKTTATTLLTGYIIFE